VDALNELPEPLLNSLPKLTKTSLTLIGDPPQSPPIEAPNKPEGTLWPHFLGPGQLPHIPPLHVILLPTPTLPTPTVEVEVARDSLSLLERVCRFLGVEVASQPAPADGLIIVENVKMRQTLAPGIDTWIESVNGRSRAQDSSAGTEDSRCPVAIRLALVTWQGALGLEADAVLVVITQPPEPTFAARVLHVGLTRARRIVRLVIAPEVVPLWLEELRKQGITYREVGNETA
jgi:hypothetical protein